MEQVVVIRKRKHGRGLIRAAAAVLLILALVGVWAVNSAIRTPVIAAARERASELLAEALNKAVLDVLKEGGVPEPKCEQRGGVLLISADTALLNVLAASMAQAAQDSIARIGREGASVDLGSATGFVPLSGSGPGVEISFVPMGHVESKLSPRLRSAGINQSLFTVELMLEAHVRLFIAGSEEELSVESTVPLCQTVIAGNVPQVYTNVANEEDMLNLIPNEAP